MAHAGTIQDPPPIRARLLGPVEIRVGDRILTGRDWPRRQSRSILLLLLGTPGHRLPRDAVLDALWPSSDLDTSLNALYKAMHALRRTLEPGLRSGRASRYIEVTGEHILLRPHEGIWVDVIRFEQLMREAYADSDSRERLRAALRLYRGAFVADEPYADWPVARRESLRASRERAVLELARLDLEQGDPLASIGHLEAILAEDPAFEEAHRAIIRALLASGQRAMALHQAERCRLALARELGVSPEAETEALVDRARAAPPAMPLASRSRRGPLRNLPGTLSPTIGRRGDIAAVLDMLAGHELRMVTIVGPGGVGKTRLGVEVARQATAHFPDGVAFVDLSSIRSESLLFHAIARALHVHEQRDQDLASTVRSVLERWPRFLLVLDNLEHLQGLDVTVAGLLADVPSLTILATSRQPLRIRAEWVCRLEPLAVPAGVDLVPERLEEVDSVALFLQCARAWSGYDATEQPADLTLVARICQRLDGLPLAIELAAARCWGTTPAAVLAQLDDRFQTLRDGPRDLPPRHRALEATIAWSYELLSPVEQAMFRKLSVFAGGIALDTLQAEFGPDAQGIADALVEKSLLRWDHLHARRLTMLESIREYAEEQLRRHGEDSAMRHTHARYFAGLLQRPGTPRTGVAQVDWEQRLEREHDNLHAALAFCLAGRESELALRLSSGLGGYWFIHGCTASAMRWIEESLALAPDNPNEDVAWSALWGAAISWRLADNASGERFEQRARAAWRVLDSAQGLARVDHAGAVRCGLEGRLDQSLHQHRANLGIFQEIGDSEGIVFSHAGIAHALGLTGEPGPAVRHLEEALAEARAADDLLLQSYVLARLPTAYCAVSRHDRAVATAEEGEHIAQLVCDRRSLPWASLVQAMLADERQDAETALGHARVALAGFQESGDILNEWLGLLVCLRAALAVRRLDEARHYADECVRRVRLMGSKGDLAVVLREVGSLLLACGHAADALAAYAAGLPSFGEDIDGLVPGFDPDRYHDRISKARDRLSPAEADAAWERGERLDVGAALDLASHWIEAGQA